MAFIYNLTDTWNDVATTWNGIKLAVTNTSSSASSNLLNLTVTGATTASFVVDKSGNLALNGTVNKITMTAPATGATLTLADGSSFITSGAYSTTFTTTGTTTLTLPTSGTVTALGNTTTGSGSIVLATSPTLVTPALGTPSSGNLSNCTAYPISALSGAGTGVLTALAVNVGSAGAFVTFNGALGTPSSGNLSNCTGYPVSSLSGTIPISSGGTGQTTATAAFNALAPSQGGNSGKFLTTDGTNASWATNPLGSVTSVDVSGGTTGLSFSGGPITTSGTITMAGTLAVANGGTGITSFGTGVATALGVNVGSAGAFVVNGGALGTPSSGTLTNATGLPLTTGVTGILPVAKGGTGITSFGTGVATALGVNVGSAGAFVVNGGALGTPSSGTLTNATGLPISTGVSGLGTGVATFLATPSSANLASAVTDETGSGPLVFATAPTFGTNITVGAAASSTGIVNFKGTTSGTVSLSVADAAGTWTLKLPTSAGTNGYYLQTDGLGNTTWAAGGGGGGGSPGGSNTQIQYNSSGSFGGSPAFTFDGSATVGLGVASTTTGIFNLYNSSSANAVSIKSGNNASAWSLTLPTSAGTNGYALTTDGTGVTSWTAVATGTINTGTVGRITYYSGTNTLSGTTTGTGVLTALGVNTGSAGAFVVNGGALGTPLTGTLTNCTGLPVSSGISGLGTSVATALAVNVGSAGAFVVNGGALGTPSSGTLTNCTSIPVNQATGVLPVANGGTNASSAGITAFNNITGYTATGATGTTSTNLVFSTSPTITTPTISGNETHTGTAARFIADFDNATVNSRFAFRTTTTNADTGIYALPNGTSTGAAWQAANAADPTNASKIMIVTNGSTDVQLVSGRNGTGTYLPLSIYTSGGVSAQFSTTKGTFGLGVAGSTQGILNFNGSTAGTVSVQGAASAGTWTFTLPTSGGTANYALTTNGSGTSSWSQISLTAGVTGTLPVANGGTGLTAGTSGGVLYYSAAGTLASSAALAASAIVLGGGAGAAPATTTTGTGVVTAIGNNTNSANGLAVLNASGYLAVAQGGTGLASGTSGGVLYYSASGTLASSAALTANALVVGGGAGAAPSTVTTGTNVLTALGVAIGSAGAVITTNNTNTFTKGFTVTSNSLTASTSFTVDPTAGNYQYITNNGAFTITAYTTKDHAVDILVTNGATAGAITLTGFTAPSGGGGDTYATTNANKYLLMIRCVNATATYVWKALQ